MEITRLFTDSEGQASLEMMELPMTPEDELGHLTSAFPATEAVICEAGCDFQQSWHTAPVGKWLSSYREQWRLHYETEPLYK